MNTRIVVPDSFNPAILGGGWKFDFKSTPLLSVPEGREIDLAKILMVSPTRGHERDVPGREARLRLEEEGRVCLPPSFGWKLFSQSLIPNDWVDKFGKLYFEGGPPLSHFGDSRIFFLYHGFGCWRWHYDYFCSPRDYTDLSAVLQ